MDQDQFVLESAVRGFHVYRSIWGGIIGEILPCITEPGNTSDSYAVAIKRSETIAGHMPRKFSAVCALFLNSGGTISCAPTGTQKYSADLPQGGLEIPCRYTFRGKSVQSKRYLNYSILTCRDVELVNLQRRSNE
jgi:hypothetical protein